MAQQSSRIVQEVHDEPHVAESRITVLFVHERVEGLGLSPEHVAEQHALELADVYHALAYYHDHPDEMAEVERRREELTQATASRSDVVTGPEDLN